MNKKAFVTVHAGLFFILGLVLGAAAMYFAISKGLLPVGAPAI